MAKMVVLYGEDVIVHASVAAMLADVNAGALPIVTTGYYAAGDGGGNVYYYDAGSSATINGGTVLPSSGGSSTMSLNSSGVYDGTDAGTGRYLAIEARYDPVLFGADPTGTVEATKFFLAALKATRNPSTVRVTPGTYLVDELDTPEKWFEIDFQRSWLTTTATANHVLDITTANDNNRPGPIILRRLYINGTGGVVGLIGIKSTTQSVGPILDNLNIKNCDRGLYIVGSLNMAVRDTIVHRCNANSGAHTDGIGFYFQNHAVNSSNNVMIIENCEGYLNEVGILLDGTQLPGATVEVFNLINCTFQSNNFCGLAAFSCSRIYDKGCYWENNGNHEIWDTGLTENTFDGHTIKRRAIHLDDSHMFTDIDSHDSIYLANGSSVTYNKGLRSRFFNSWPIPVETDGSACTLRVFNHFYGAQSYQALIPEIPIDNGIVKKCATIQPYRPKQTTDIANLGAGYTNLCLPRQTSSGIVSYSVGTVADSTLHNGYRNEIVFSTGGTDGAGGVDQSPPPATNFFLVQCGVTDSISVDDEVIFQFPIRVASGQGLFDFNFVTGTHARGQMWVDETWRMFTIQFRALGANNTDMYISPGDLQGLTLYLGGAMVYKLADSPNSDRTPIQRIVHEQLWSNI